MSEQTYWNGESCEARRVSIVVGPSPHPVAWSHPFEGQERPAVEVRYGSDVFFLDDVDGLGWRKVTDGRGSPSRPHRSVYPEPGSVVYPEIERDRQLLRETDPDRV